MIRRESVGSIDQVMTALREVEETVGGAQRLLGDRCMVNKAFLLQRTEIIARCLPEAVTAAADVIKEEQAILEAARRSAAEQLQKAREEAQKIIDEAKKQANEMNNSARKAGEEAARAAAETKSQAASMRLQAEKEIASMRQQATQEAQAYVGKAQQDASNIIAKAQQDAQAIVAQGENAARAAVAQDNVHRMAVVEAEEIRDATNKSMLLLRQQCVDYLDNILEDADRYLVSLTTDIRKQRQALDGHR